MKLRNLLSFGFCFMYGFFMILFGNGVSYMRGAVLLFLILSSIVGAIIIWGIWNLELGVREADRNLYGESSSKKKKREERPNDNDFNGGA